MSRERILMIISSSFVFFYLLVNVFYDFYSKKIFSSTGNLVVSIILYIAVAVGASLLMYYSISKKEKLEDHRGMIMIFSILFFLFNIISGVLGFIVFKFTDKKEKRELPKLEVMKGYNIFIYIILLVISVFLILFGDMFTNSNTILISMYVVIMSICIFIFRKDLKRDFKYFKEYFREYNSFVFITYLKSLGVLVVLSLAIRLSTGIETATNQENINLMFEYMPLLTIFLSVIYAPITEELLFRGCFGKFFKNKWLYIIICGVSFGLLHVIDDFQSVQELLYILVYSSLGCFLSYTYYKTKNLWCNIYFHFLQNSISLLAIFLLKFLG